MMLKDEDIVIEIGRTAGGGDCMKVIHQPTGIMRSHGPPLLKPGKIQRQLLDEIEAEMHARGLLQHLVPGHPVKRNGQVKIR